MKQAEITVSHVVHSRKHMMLQTSTTLFDKLQVINLGVADFAEMLPKNYLWLNNPGQTRHNISQTRLLGIEI
jgi:hypothetical protein